MIDRHDDADSVAPVGAENTAGAADPRLASWATDMSRLRRWSRLAA